jgi:microcystin-dependent protein
MSEPFLGEIRIVSFNFPPRGWALCNGQLLPINQNQALFSLLGTTYGGDGRVTFGLPNLQGRMPVHAGAAVVQGETAGEPTHTLSLAELPGHSHPVGARSNANTTSPAAALWANGGKDAFAPSPNAAMNAATVSSIGGGQPHQNMPPFLILNFVIALVGIFPSRN